MGHWTCFAGHFVTSCVHVCNVSVFVDVYYSLQSGWVSFRVFSVVFVSVGLLCTTYAVFCVVTLRVCGLRPSRTSVRMQKIL